MAQALSKEAKAAKAAKAAETRARNAFLKSLRIPRLYDIMLSLCVCVCVPVFEVQVKKCGTCDAYRLFGSRGKLTPTTIGCIIFWQPWR